MQMFFCHCLEGSSYLLFYRWDG